MRSELSRTEPRTGPTAAEIAGVRFLVDVKTREAVAARLFAPAMHGARILKQNTKRTVFVLDDPVLGSLIVKHHRIVGLRESVAARVKASRAAHEIAIARALLAAGVRTPEPIASFVDVGRGFAFAVTRALRDATPLGTFLERRHAPGDGKSQEKRAILSAAISLLVSIHRAGFDHRDFHGGNILVAADGALHVIDLHRVAKCVPSRKRRLRALADLLHTLRYALDDSDSEYALDEYARLTGGSFVAATDRTRIALRSLIARRERARIRSRARRCLVESSAFARIARGGCRGFRRREVSEIDLFAAISAAREQIASGGPLLRSLSRRSEVAIGQAGDDHYAVKAYLSDGVRSLRGRVTGGRGKRAWRAANALFVRDVAIPRPVAWIQTPDRSFLICDEVKDAVPLHVLAFRYSTATLDDRSAEARRVASAVADLVANLFAANAQVNDLSPKNVLVAVDAQGVARATLCDFDGVRLKKPTRERMIQALAQLNDLAPSTPLYLRLLVLRRLKKRFGALGGVSTARAIGDRTAARSTRRLSDVPSKAIPVRAN